MRRALQLDIAISYDYSLAESPSTDTTWSSSITGRKVVDVVEMVSRALEEAFAANPLVHVSIFWFL